MKRFFVFLGVFAVGLAVLLWIQSRMPKPAPVVTPGAEPTASTTPQGELSTFQTDKGKQVQGVLSGSVDIFNKWPESHRLRSHVTAKNAVSVSEGVYDLATVVLQIYRDTSPSELDSETHAGSARAKINSDLKQAALDETYPITLFDVAATLSSGSRFCPLTLRVPVLEGVYGTKHFESREQVAIDGRGLTASGHGLVFDGLSESMRLLENPQAAVELKAGDTAHLSSRGELQIHSRTDLGPDVVELEAKDQAVLRLEGAQPFALEADVVRLFGVIVKGESERFVPTRAEAEGHVTLEPAEGVFSGTTAVIDYDALGKPRHAALDGDPRCTLVLRGARLENVPPELLVEGETLTVTLEGAGPLELFFDAGERFSFNGPATLRLPGVDATLHGNGSIGGALGTDGRFHELDVAGGTTFDYESAHLETEDLTVTEFIDDQQRAAVRLVAPGSAHSTGTLPDGRTFDLTATGGMTAERRRDSFVVPVGDGVDIVVTGERAFRAHADHVHDFDSQQLTLGADGHVHYENDEGQGDGEHLETFAPQRGELTGTDEIPARFEFAQGTFQAHFIEFDPDRIQARVDARAKVAFGAERYDLGARWVVVERDPKPEDREASHGYVLDAGGDVHARVANATEVWNLGSQSFHAVAEVALDDKGKEQLVPAGMTASEGVAFDYTGKLVLRGNGDRLEVTADRIGHLTPAHEPDAKVNLAGTLPDRDLDFRMRASSVDFSPESLIAIGPDIDLQGLDLPWADRDAPPAERALRAVAGRLACDRESIFFSEGVYIGGRTPTHQDWSLDAPRVLLSGSAEQGAADQGFGALHDLLAWGGFSARMGEMGSMTGEHMQLVNGRRTITIAGEPAQILQPGVTWSSTWFDLDLDTGFVRSESGEMRGASDPKLGGGWTLRYSALEPITTADTTIQVLREPVMTLGEEQVRASWAIAWVDATEWGKFTGAVMPKPGERAAPRETPPGPPKPKQAKPKNLFERFRASEISHWLREFYLEGNVEYRKHDERNARAEAAYFDLLDGHGWLRDVDLSIEVPFRGRDDMLKVQADWMHVSQDGSMQAYNAVATSCTYDEPHYVIHIGNYSRKPRYKESTPTPEGEQPAKPELDGYDMEMTNNSIASPGGVEIPVPRIAYPTDPEGGIDRNAFNVGGITIPSFGKDSKFGTFISTSVTTQLGWLSRKINFLINKLVFPKLDLPEAKGHTTYSGAYFGSRGGRVGSESDIDSAGFYHMNVRLDVIYDTGEDHGLVRVPETDRSEFRSWFRERGRFFLDDGEWIDAVITYQTDPGVQSEFFEGDYIEFEERETYLHWRRADGVEYLTATIEARLEDFRTEVVARILPRSQPGRNAGQVRTALLGRHQRRPPRALRRRPGLRGSVPRRTRRSRSRALRYRAPHRHADAARRDGPASDALHRGARHRLERERGRGFTGLARGPARRLRNGDHVLEAVRERRPARVVAVDHLPRRHRLDLRRSTGRVLRSARCADRGPVRRLRRALALGATRAQERPRHRGAPDPRRRNAERPARRMAAVDRARHLVDQHARHAGRRDARRALRHRLGQDRLLAHLFRFRAAARSRSRDRLQLGPRPQRRPAVQRAHGRRSLRTQPQVAARGARDVFGQGQRRPAGVVLSAAPHRPRLRGRTQHLGHRRRRLVVVQLQHHSAFDLEALGSFDARPLARAAPLAARFPPTSKEPHHAQSVRVGRTGSLARQLLRRDARRGCARLARRRR
jgi:hypothetical protein